MRTEALSELFEVQAVSFGCLFQTTCCISNPTLFHANPCKGLSLSNKNARKCKCLNSYSVTMITKQVHKQEHNGFEMADECALNSVPTSPRKLSLNVCKRQQSRCLFCLCVFPSLEEAGARQTSVDEWCRALLARLLASSDAATGSRFGGLG